ncbi:LacI family DNA-binding transcriptional regulator [Paenibacillus abyssi]|uniref:LacI family DNA-binding transcriptional regulator n=1 Tax=Paenibacillus abyssi TaxID=1340531 RepID=UPI0036155133
MATIKDVAKLAGISVSTVSRVLNKSGYVNEETLKKVNLAIKQLNYKPSQIARGMISRKTNTLGLILPDIRNVFFPELARAIEDVAQKQGYSVIVCNSDNDREKEESYFQLLQEKYVDGIILAGEVTDNQVQTLKDRGIAFLVIDTIVDFMPVLSVHTDHINGAFLAVTHLIEQGYRRIAHIRGPAASSTAENRLEGYKQALSKAGIAYDSSLVQMGDYQIESGHDAMNKLLVMSNPPDAVFVANDLMALGAMDIISDRGLKIPDDIGIIGFDGLQLGSVVKPKLSTVAQPIYEIGTIAAEMLIESIRNPKKRKTALFCNQSW